MTLPAGHLLPESWSPDGRRMAGATWRESVQTGIGVYDLTSGEGRQLSADSVLVQAMWMPDGDRVIYVTGGGELVVIDVETAERRSIPVDLPFPPENQAFAAAPDGTALYYGGRRVESNIWMVERTEPGS